MMDWLQLLLGGVLLYFGAEWFVGGASALALALRIPQLLVGLTVVAYGTSAPEIIVGIAAAREGHGDVALGNVVGSNIANIGLILGIAALIRPARVHAALRRRELPVLVASAAIVPILLLDDTLSALEGAGLLVVALVYTLWMIRAARTSSELRSARIDATSTQEAADLAGAPREPGRLWSVVTAGTGLAVLLVGGQLFVSSAVLVAHSIGISDRLVGLTIVAVGTSLPELVTSVIAAHKGHSDLAVGNVIGSNIFNCLLCLGAAALSRPLNVPMRAVAVDLGIMFGMTMLSAVFIRTERIITRVEGAFALACYAGFTLLTVMRG